MNETIGNRISAFRKEKHLTQEELANTMGVSSQAVSKWENDASYQSGFQFSLCLDCRSGLYPDP